MNLRKFFLAVVAALTVSAAVVSSASAITHGRPDGNTHPYVGLMVALDKDGVPLWRCSGSLLSPTVFLTAGHCTVAPAARIEVWMEEVLSPTTLIMPRLRTTIRMGSSRATHPPRSMSTRARAMSVGFRIPIRTSATRAGQAWPTSPSVVSVS